jgi:hypothetical protein
VVVGDAEGCAEPRGGAKPSPEDIQQSLGGEGSTLVVPHTCNVCPQGPQPEGRGLAAGQGFPCRWVVGQVEQLHDSLVAVVGLGALDLNDLESPSI